MPRPGDACRVVFDDVEYECVAFEHQVEGLNEVGVGNELYLNYGPDSSEPFVFLLGEHEYGFTCVMCNDAGTHTFSLEIIHEEIHHLDPKYIKDMYYTSDSVKTTLIEEQTVTIDEDGGYVPVDANIFFEVGKTYFVDFNGTEYECVAWGNGGCHCIGNGDIYGGEGMGGDEPFSFDSYNNGDIYVNVAIAGTYTFSITEVQQEVHHIDPKYIKDMYYTKDNKVKTALLESSFSQGYLELSNFPIQSGETYIVVFDGIEYECVSWYGNGYEVDFTGIGNGNMDDMLPKLGGNEPFVIYGYGTSPNHITIYTGDDSNHSISIAQMLPEVVKIPEKYMPDTVAHVEHTHDASDITVGYDLEEAYGTSSLEEVIEQMGCCDVEASVLATLDEDIYHIAYGNGTYVALSYNQIYSSTDKIKWTQRAFNRNGMYSSQWNDLKYLNNMFVAVSSTCLGLSTDGITWIAIKMPPIESSSNYYIAYGEGVYVLAGGNDSYQYYSFDCIEWHKTSDMSMYPSNCGIAYGNGRFVIANPNRHIAYSEDGIVWTKVLNAIPATWVLNGKVSYVNNQFMITDGRGNISTSKDGVTWSEFSYYGVGKSNIWYNGGVFLCTSKYSINGKQWHSMYDTGLSFSDIIYTCTEEGFLGIDGRRTVVELKFSSKLGFALKDEDYYALQNKQDKIVGTQGQSIGFNSNGDIVAQNFISSTYMVMTDITNGYTYNVYMQNGNLVSSPQCIGIKVITPPTKVEYNPGDLFNPAGMTIAAIYSDGSTSELDNNLFTNIYVDSNNCITLNYIDEVGITHTITSGVLSLLFVDFESTDNGNGTVTLTDWKGTLNGAPSTELIIPDDPRIIL